MTTEEQIKYLQEAVFVYQIELPAPDTIDYTSERVWSNFLKYVEQQKADKLKSSISPSDSTDTYLFRRLPEIPPVYLDKPSTPKAYGQMLQNKHRGKHRK